MKKLLKKSLAVLLATGFCPSFYACGTPPDDVSTSNESSPEITSPLPPDPTPTPPAQAVNKTQTYIRLTSSRVNVRAGAGTSYAVIGSAEEGEIYAVVGKSGKWYETRYKKKTAYIYAEYVVALSLEKSPQAKVEEVLSEGYALLGTPYVYGAVRLHDGKGNFLKGFTAQKFDCSSLVQYVFYQGAGKLLNTTTRTQVTQGLYVPRDELKRGDCIYFTNAERYYKQGLERIGHVAVYLGDNYILHTASDYARIEPISAQRWRYYVEARRFL